MMRSGVFRSIGISGIELACLRDAHRKPAFDDRVVEAVADQRFAVEGDIDIPGAFQDDFEIARMSGEIGFDEGDQFFAFPLPENGLAIKTCFMGELLTQGQTKRIFRQIRFYKG